MEIKKLQEYAKYYDSVTVKSQGSRGASAAKTERNTLPSSDKVELSFDVRSVEAYEKARAEKVKTLRQSVAEGRYRRDAQEIAAAMFEESW